jgi:hypothetical protein
MLCVTALAAACRDKPAVKVKIDCEAYVAHVETVIATDIDSLVGEKRESARRHFAETNPQARADLLAKCHAIDTTTSDKIECVMTAHTPAEVGACPDF